MKSSARLVTQLFSKLLGIVCCFLLLASCQEDEPDMGGAPLKDAVTYKLDAVPGSGIHGYVTFSRSEENESNVIVDVKLAGTEGGKSYPVYINFKSAVEGGEEAITLEPVAGDMVPYTNTRTSRTIISETNEGTAFTIESLADFDGHVVVQKSESDPAIVSKGDIGSNTLTGASKTYALKTIGGSKITGNVTFNQRKNGFTQVVVQLDTTIENGEFPMHIHSNAAAVGGGIAIDLNSVDGNTGMSITTVRKLKGDGGAAITYEELLNFNGYVNIHQSLENLATIIAQTDIGSNELTGQSATYPLDPMSASGQKGQAVFAERKNGQTLVTLMLEGTAQGEAHPAHIHANTAAESGGIVISLDSIVGNASVTNVTMFDDGTPVTYSDLINYNGYINVHKSTAELATVLSQGDIGANALTGESIAYPLGTVDAPGIKGKAVFYQRNNGSTLVEIMLEGTPDGGSHPAHIHVNTAAEGGAIAISLNNIKGTTGMSKTSVRQFDNGAAVTYEQLLTYDGYINVHQSANNLATIVAQGDIGANALTGKKVIYTLKAVGNSGVSGTATFSERNNGTALVTLKLEGTAILGDHPAHIHLNSAAEGGAIAISLNNVNGATGMSKTNIEKQDNNVAITYEELVGFDGYINVHQSALDLNTLLVQGDIGANAKVE